MAVQAPRVNDKRVDEETGERQRFSSKILPAYARRSPKVNDVLPVLYLRGLSTGDFRPALEQLLGEDAAGLSPSTISRLCKDWEAEHERFRKRARCASTRYAYLFVDGVHVSVRLGEDDRLCLLVVIGVREDGDKELLAVEDGYRESTESLGGGDARSQAPRAQRAQARDRRRRARHVGGAARRVPRRAPRRRAGCTRSPTSSTRCPSGCSPTREEAAARDRWRPRRARTPAQALRALPRASSMPSTPRRSPSSTATGQHLTAFYDFPAEHWRHLRTSNAIESSFATVKLRTRVTKGAGSKKAALAMAYKLLDAAQERWRRFNGHELVADVLAGATFKDGIRGHRRRNHDDGREGRRLILVTPRSTTFDNCSPFRGKGLSV